MKAGGSRQRWFPALVMNRGGEVRDVGGCGCWGWNLMESREKGSGLGGDGDGGGIRGEEPLVPSGAGSRRW